MPTKPPGNAIPLTDLANHLEEAEKEAILILQDTSNWPKDSTILVKELLDIISNAPTLQEERFKSPSITPEFQGSVERFTSVMKDVCARLNKAYRKYGSNRELSDVMKYPFASLSKDGCGTALLKCKYDIDKALASLRDHLENEPATEHSLGGQVDESPSAPDRTSNHPTDGGGTTSVPHDPSPQPNFASSPEVPVSTQQPAPSAQSTSPNDEKQTEQAAARRRPRLDVARTTFETIEAISGTIPVVGSYIGAGAKVGLAVVNMIQVMDSNRETVKDLEIRTAQLSDLLGYFKDRSVEHRREEFLRHLTELQSELRSIQSKLGELNSQATLRNLFGSGGQADALKEYQDTIHVALEELQLLVSLNTTHLLNELYDGEVRKEQRRLLDRLGDASYGARGNAVDEVICLPGTRVEVLERIDDWIRNSAPSERVLWIRGMAGRGKSTIASTVVHNWRYRAALAIFHFRRGQTTSDKRLVCSLARQLGSSMVSEVKEAILQSVRENEDIGQERLHEQFKVLLVASAERLQRAKQPILIVVDALDECEETKYAVDFINLIHQHASSMSAPLKFLLTTRPETPLLLALKRRCWQTEDLDVVAGIDDDIAELLQRRLSVTRENHSLGPEWPPHDAIVSLVKMSQGLFQWAQTAVEYISGGSPELRLQELLESPSLCDDLDSLYAQILSKAYDKAKKRPGRGELLLRLLGTLAAAPYPVSPDIFTYLFSHELIFRSKTQQQSVQLLRLEIACDIRSVVFIPDSPSQPMRLVHTSVRDLLVDQGRCGVEPYFIDLNHEHRDLTMLCFELMERDLRQNICGLSDLSKSNREIQGVVEQQVSNGLRYCCRSWSMHLVRGNWSSEMAGVLLEAALNNLRRLSETKLLCWLEIMSLIEATLEALEITKQACAWLQDTHSVMFNSDLTIIWNDAHRFISTFLEPISFGALHIYASALPFCPTVTKLWQYYSSHATTRILHGTRDMTWSPSLWERTTGSPIRSAVFLQNGKVIASGTEDGAIQLWDSRTGTRLREPLMGHTKEVAILAVSPDGQILASGSWDRTICLRNAETGDLLCQPLCGHTGGVVSLAFSLDGKTLLSASYDDTIRVWDCGTGCSLGEPVPYSRDRSLDVLLSPNAEFVVSSCHKEIKLWNTQTGTQLGQRFQGHSDEVRELAISPDSNILASSSLDRTIRLWYRKNGAVLHCLRDEASDLLCALVFSPIGDILVSGSNRGAIKLWNVETGTQQGEYRTSDHSAIISLAFSPNGKIFASRSGVRTIQLWDFQTIPQISTPATRQSRCDRISAIALSPDGKMLASADGDGHIRLWDIKTGEPLNEHSATHYWETCSLAFSSEGTVLASGCSYGEIYLCDISTWELLGSPLKGQEGHIVHVAFSANGNVMLSGDLDGKIRVWNSESWKPIGSPCDGKYPVLRLACAPDGKFIASSHEYSDTVILWDANTSSLVGSLDPVRNSPLNSLEFLSDQRLLVTYDDHNVQYDFVTSQRHDIQPNIGYRAYRLFPDPLGCFSLDEESWISFRLQRLFWLPARYRPYIPLGILVCNGRLVFVPGSGELFFLDISRSLGL